MILPCNESAIPNTPTLRGLPLEKLNLPSRYERYYMECSVPVMCLRRRGNGLFARSTFSCTLFLSSIRYPFESATIALLWAMPVVEVRCTSNILTASWLLSNDQSLIKTSTTG